MTGTGTRTAAALLALALAGAAAGPALAQGTVEITPQLVAAAKKEGKVVYYTSVDLKVAEKIARAFEAKYDGITVQVERTGAERLFQRIGQEYSSGIHNVDTVNSSDAAHFVHWKREGWLAAALPAEVAKHYPKDSYDAEGMHAPWRMTLSPIAYNSKLVQAADAPKSFADLLDAKWQGKIVKAHPGYSGSILTATFQVSRDIGWQFFEKLAAQRIMQVQSATDPPKKVVAGERPVMADGVEYVVLLQKKAGAPIELVYPSEGTPLIIGPSAVMKNAPNPNAARLFHAWSFSQEAQQLMVDEGKLRSFHPGVKETDGRKPLSEIKLMKDDPEGVDKTVEEIKQRYTRYFKT